MAAVNIPYSEKLLKDVFDKLNSTGFYCLENAVDKNLQKRIYKDVINLIENKGNRYFSIVDVMSDPNLSFRHLQNDIQFKSFLTSLSKLALKRDVEDHESLNVLRVVTGSKSDTQSLKFHYDAYALTALIPIIIPKEEIKQSGHLVSFSNMRQLRSSSIINFLEKLILQNRLVRRSFSKTILSNLDKYVHIMQPGNIYLFWGYRTLHANLPVNPLFKRATLLYHVGDVHPKSAINKFIKYLRHTSEKDNTNK